MNLSPFASKLIWSFVSSLFERFFMCFLFPSIVIIERFWRLTFLRSLRLLVAPPGGGVLDISLGGEVRRGPSYPDPV